MDQYLERYAEPGTAAASDIPRSGPWRRVVVIPVCNESTGILRPLPPASGRSLMIVVVNETGAALAEVSSRNRAFAAEVAERFDLLWQSDPADGLFLYSDPATERDLLLVDRFSEGLRLPPKGGVGHARKIGADIAAQLVQQGRIESPWIHCSDADVVLPSRYFTASDTVDKLESARTSCLIFPFRHGGVEGASDGRIAHLTKLYEYSLRYYVAGLNFAGSPYAFHTVGSTLAVNASHYCMVRGFPRRQAGEDFYLLNKLAKVGSIRQLAEEMECEPIVIEARMSDRVPFGTGAAVGQMAELADPAKDYVLYHPDIFMLLRGWLESLPLFWRRQSSDVSRILEEGNLGPLDGPLLAAGAAGALGHALRQSSNPQQFMRQMHTWFDAFRTLKLIHFLREHHFPSVGFEVLVKGGMLDHLVAHEPVLPELHAAFRV